MLRYLLDTNICIYIIKEKPAHTVEIFRQHPFGTIAVSTVTEAELAYGVSKSLFVDKNRTSLKKFLEPLTVIPFSSQSAYEFGRLRSYLEKKGSSIGPYDLMLASQALSDNLTLVTNNEFEFSRVPNLKIENWAKS